MAALCGLAAPLASPPAHADDNDDRLARIEARGTLRVCIWPDYYAITYRNPRTRTLDGIDIDMAQAFADDLGVDLTFVDSSFADLVTDITTGACDIAMHGVGVRADRARHMDFSDPHLVSGIYAVTPVTHPTVTRWGDIDQPGHVVAVHKGTFMEPEMRARLRNAELLVVDAFKEREQAVLSGRADVFMTDYPYGWRMAALTDWARLLAPPEPVAPTPYAYAVPRNEPAWLARVNAFVRAAKADGRLRRAAERHGLLPILAE
ncbi:ABC transporter substrate-binding protein [Roseospira visakhapatnamensis]|uniref:ABC-type amino acid transport substrate-binding protein n=1 Tax=Roseospira visakhapatnamensis TaxID=390880 RepID=A0A7W6RD44_9PROT|nr:ABC transporter substrate-binding protein [Roseospira visakhapatnamensis]MBB4266257.1 ABC-type amino acid transport substrate-binding protein [Roseospira visakhapatnamensis]